MPRCTEKVTSLLATTPGKRLVMPCSSTAGATIDPASATLWAESVMAHTPRTGPATLRAMIDEPGAEDTEAREARYRASPGPCVIPCNTQSKRHLRPGRNHDLAVDDLLLEGAELGLDVVHLAAGQAVADATGLQVIDLVARSELALGHGLDEVERRDVNLLDHRGDDDALDVGRRGQRLVGVDTDRHLARGRSGGEHTATRATCCGRGQDGDR